MRGSATPVLISPGKRIRTYSSALNQNGVSCLACFFLPFSTKENKSGGGPIGYPIDSTRALIGHRNEGSGKKNSRDWSLWSGLFERLRVKSNFWGAGAN